MTITNRESRQKSGYLSGTVVIIFVFILLIVFMGYGIISHADDRETLVYINNLVQTEIDVDSNTRLNDQDAWGRTLLLIKEDIGACEHSGCELIRQSIISSGEDGIFGSADDIGGYYVFHKRIINE